MKRVYPNSRRMSIKQSLVADHLETIYGYAPVYAEFLIEDHWRSLYDAGTLSSDVALVAQKIHNHASGIELAQMH